MHFMSSLRECDVAFADYLWGIEKRQGTKDDVEIDILSLDPTQTQLAGARSSRLIDVQYGRSVPYCRNDYRKRHRGVAPSK